MDAGWYIDPSDPGSGRYHDGSNWTDTTVEIPPGKTLPRAPAEAPLVPAPLPIAQRSLEPAPPSGAAPAKRNGAKGDGAKGDGAKRDVKVLVVALVAIVIGALVIVVVAVNHNSGNSADRDRPTSTACQFAFIQAMTSPADPSTPPGPLLTCTAKEWRSVYRQTAIGLGGAHVNDTAALQAACLRWQAAHSIPQACIGVSPPTSGR